MPPAGEALERELRRIVGAEHVQAPVPADAPCNSDATGAWRGLHGRADALVRPASAEEVAEVLSLCYRQGVPLVPRGGGSGVSGGACPIQGGVVCETSRMRNVIELEPGLWRMHVQAGLSTAHVHRLAQESGLMFPPDPGAAEQSQIGGNVATDAGGPHAFKYGSTGAWVTGLQAVLAPGQIVELGGATRKDVAGYDLKRLLTGSEGTLGVITSVHLRLIPRPQKALGLVAFTQDRATGCEAILAALGSGTLPAALDFAEGEALMQVAGAYPGATARRAGSSPADRRPGSSPASRRAGTGSEGVPPQARFALVAELDGEQGEAQRSRRELAEALAPLALTVDLHDDAESMWRWREGISGAVAAVRGGKVSEDVAVPVERLAPLLDRFEQIARAEGLASCSWGHGGDGNAHATVLVDPRSPAEMEAAERVVGALFDEVSALGGSVSGEHGIGLVKRDALAAQLGDTALALHRAVKRTLDPKGLINPGKKGV